MGKKKEGDCKEGELLIEIRHDDGLIEIKGHAGYAPHGQDIVCAAISALTQVFIESVDKLTDDKLKCVITAGNAFIRYENLSADAQLLMDSFFIGLTMIAEEYPKNVQIAQALKA